MNIEEENRNAPSTEPPLEKPTAKEVRDRRQQERKKNSEEAARKLGSAAKSAIQRLGFYGALVERAMAAHDWRALVDEKYVRVYQTVLGPVLALTAEGRLAHDTIGVDEGWPPAHYLNGSSAVVDRAYQMLAMTSLEDVGYTVDDVDLRRRTLKNPVGGATTDLVVCIRMRPPNVTYTAAEVADIGYPPLFASIGQGGAGVAQLRRLARDYGARVTSWQHPVMVAVPEVTPGMRRLVDVVRETKRCEVIRLIEIPVVPLTSG